MIMQLAPTVTEHPLEQYEVEDCQQCEQPASVRLIAEEHSDREAILCGDCKIKAIERNNPIDWQTRFFQPTARVLVFDDLIINVVNPRLFLADLHEVLNKHARKHDWEYNYDEHDGR